MSKALHLPDQATEPAQPRRRSSRKVPWAKLAIWGAVERLHRRGAPLADLNNAQITKRCSELMRDEDGKLAREIPSPRSFERYLPEMVADVLSRDALV
jgi:hypothetical protein